jgi:(E)-4-hydroxy-3-methylbut-2-enyl-diphosphate synthase
MTTKPAVQIQRRDTRRLVLGGVPVGAGAPVTVQTMTKTDTRDIDATVSQIHEIAAAGGEIVRLAVVDAGAADALCEICRQVSLPVVADIHFDHRLALRAVAAGVQGLRINPGNIGTRDHVAEIVAAARERAVPIRIGVNSGSVEPDLRKTHGRSARALVESALRHVRILEDLNYREIKISVKATDVWRTVEAYRMLADATSYPLHVGLTEAGTLIAGTVRSSVAIGLLLAEGIGDTIRVSLTDTPVREVQVGLELLRCLGLRPPGPNVISCPTCGRCGVDLLAVCTRVEMALAQFYRETPAAPRPVVAVMGCVVNGPGEAKDADIAIAGGSGRFALYVRGEYRATLDEPDAVGAIVAAVRAWRPAAETPAGADA